MCLDFHPETIFFFFFFPGDGRHGAAPIRYTGVTSLQTSMVQLHKNERNQRGGALSNAADTYAEATGSSHAARTFAAI
ncbi:hypothetical protein JOB18_040569 [Solea senegalensis]|uniref:Uncharacterized protein n=1 Tax=Solea senegalensis TaxID=28829 RepID=A0AAV6PQ73_SOLSE|nr:hypothetical protein JOB18_040569 [Solea senegalensis]